MREQPRVFIDTVYLIATFDERDDWADIAESIRSKYDSHRLVTTDGVISEFLAHCSRGGSAVRMSAVEHINRLESSPLVEVVELSRRLVSEAISAYGGEFRYARFSLQDCISILVMRERGISDALTADREFTLAGINVLMHSPSARS